MHAPSLTPPHVFPSTHTHTHSALEGLGDTPLWQLQRDCSHTSSSSCSHDADGGNCMSHHAHHTAALIHATHGGQDLDGDGTIGGFSPLTTKMDLGALREERREVDVSFHLLQRCFIGSIRL